MTAHYAFIVKTQWFSTTAEIAKTAWFLLLFPLIGCFPCARVFCRFRNPNANSGSIMNDRGGSMAIDYPQVADFLRDELHQFLRIVRQSDKESTRRAAAERLWAAVNKVEAFSYAPGEEQWNALSESQRWGYLRLESYMGTALYELRQLQGVQWRIQAHLPTSNGTGGESNYA
jgi:hypothetical protein